MSRYIEQLGYFLFAFVLIQMLMNFSHYLQLSIVLALSLSALFIFQKGLITLQALYCIGGGSLYAFLSSMDWFRGIEAVTKLIFILDLKEGVHNVAKSLPQDVRPWYLGILFGDISYLSASIKDSFKSSGLFHLLVLSGAHVTILYAFVCGTLTYPLRIFYALKWLSANNFYILSRAILLLSAILLFIYCAVTGFFPPTQRAFIISTLALILSLIGLKLPLFQKICIAVFFQVLLFPSSFFSLSTLISWCVYLLMLGIYNSESFFAELHFQVLVFVFMWVVFAQSNLISLLLNPIAIRIFPFILISALFDFTLTSIVGGTIFSKVVAEIQRVFIGGITNIDKISNDIEYLTIDILWSFWMRTAIVGIIFAAVLNSIAKVSKRKKSGLSGLGLG